VRLRNRRPATREQLIRGYLALAYVAGTIAGFTVSLTVGFAVLAVLSLLMGAVVWLIGQDDEPSTLRGDGSITIPTESSHQVGRLP
jgi:hypothetical protein